MTFNLCAGFGGKKSTVRASACFCSTVPYQEEMGEVPNLTNGAIQVSLPENSSLANSCEGCVVWAFLLQDILAGMQLSRPVVQVLVSALSSSFNILCVHSLATQLTKLCY